MASAVERAIATRNVTRQARVLEWWSQELSQAKEYDEALKLVDQSIALREKLGPPDGAILDVLMQRVVILRAQGSPVEAKRALDGVVDVAGKVLGRESSGLIPVLVASSDNLKELGDLSGARDALQRALGIAQRPDAGPAASWLPQLWATLARVFYAQGDTKEAERAYRADLAAAERIFGPNHPRTGAAFFDLALFFKTEGRYAEAEESLLRTLRIHESQPIPEGTPIAYAANALGEIYVQKDRNQEAEAALKKAIALCDKEMEHSDTWEYKSLLGNALGTLGNLYNDVGRYREAQPLLERAVLVLKTPERLDRLFWNDVARRLDALRRIDGLENLANLYYWQSKYSEAEPLFRKVLEMREKALAPDHPYVARSLGNLGKVLDMLGRSKEATPLIERALEMQEKRYGADSPRVATQVMKLASAYGHVGRVAEKETLLRRALAIRERSAPGTEEHGTVLNDLALILQDLHRFQEAETMLQRALEISEKIRGPEHSETATVLQNIGILNDDVGRYGQAETFERRALAIRRKAFGSTSPDVAESLKHLGMLYWHAKSYTKAERYLKDGLTMTEATLGPAHPDAVRCRNNLVSFLKARNRSGEAAALERGSTEAP